MVGRHGQQVADSASTSTINSPPLSLVAFISKEKDRQPVKKRKKRRGKNKQHKHRANMEKERKKERKESETISGWDWRAKSYRRQGGSSSSCCCSGISPSFFQPILSLKSYIHSHVSLHQTLDSALSLWDVRMRWWFNSVDSDKSLINIFPFQP